MPYYKGTIDEFISSGDSKGAKAVVTRLMRLRSSLDEAVPARNVCESILIATWNIREFGANRKCGKRVEESLLYIAEIISRFDLIAIQEVNANLADLQHVLRLLGSWWDYIVTDVSPGQSGNEERIAFVFDSRKLRFDHLAGEVTLASRKGPVDQLARSPFICAFRTGWRRIAVCSVHIYYGTGKPNDADRVSEISAVAESLSNRNTRRQSTADGEPESVILLGDFNIFNRTGDETSKALERHNFIVPQALRRLAGSNLTKDKYFDQIAFHDPARKLSTSKRAGIFEFTKAIFGDDEVAFYNAVMQRSAPGQYEKAKDKEAFYKQWRTFQLSDHFPLWLELKTDFTNAYLGSVLNTLKTQKT